MTKTFLLAGAASLVFTAPALAQGIDVSNHGMHAHHDHHSHHGAHDHSQTPAAPIGVMGDHLHEKGGWMLSYRFMRMHMDGNQIGTDDVSPEEIVTTVANRFSGVAGQPATLRVVPTEMDMNMHMFGAMYAPTDWLTLMGMAMWQEKDMEHITFQGGAGTTRLGTFKTQSEGWGDTKLSALVGVFNNGTHRIHLNLGLSLPTGSIKESGVVLAPNGMTPRLRLPYAMQLGTGTYDFHPGVTYTGHQDDWSWGAQYSAEIRLEDENSQGYSWGDKHGVTAWGGYRWAEWLSSSVRLTASTQDKIDGIDPNIVAPVQTADPDNFGGEIVEAGLGFTLTGVEGWSKDHSLGIEFTAPLYQDLNGPQMERDYALTLGWKTSF